MYLDKFLTHDHAVTSEAIVSVPILVRLERRVPTHSLEPSAAVRALDRVTPSVAKRSDPGASRRCCPSGAERPAKVGSTAQFARLREFDRIAWLKPLVQHFKALNLVV